MISISLILIHEMISMKKMFYNSVISNVVMNIKLNNIEDMSYMFAGTNIDYENMFESYGSISMKI